ncbi:hypothetical protein [Halorussus sp. MSC15.2]|uniref:DUF7523 family protein n=1 Tax=Halorussus sp. MSC15.2 TaxID=2283638 RepID=UPI0013D837EC|nr:hypothetical protein [Halorussus sp. MSC15.2]NEU56917.1 hypothetical protein [Halorussus sp. MSC15.2]
MSLAEDARDAVRRRPFLFASLRANVVNYTAAARFLSDDVDGDAESIATALRRFAESLPDYETAARTAHVSMESGLGETDDPDDALLVVGGTALAPGEGSLTGVVASGDADASALRHVLGRLDAAGVGVRAAGVADDAIVLAVERRDGPDTVRVVEDALDAVPESE